MSFYYDGMCRLECSNLFVGVLLFPSVRGFLFACDHSYDSAFL